MNKIFKVIWSKARNCYVVVSELAKSHDDDHVRRSRSGCCRKAAVLAAFALTTSLAAVPVWAADGNGNITNNEASTMTVVILLIKVKIVLSTGQEILLRIRKMLS